jgi:hypothetical protein
MSFQRTRPPGDTLEILLRFIHQAEGAGNALLQVVAGTQNGAPFNLTEFQFTTQNLPTVSFVPVTQPVDSSDQIDKVRSQIESTGKTVLFLAPIFDETAAPNFDPKSAKMIAVCRDGPVAAPSPIGGVNLQVPVPGPPPGSAVQGTTALTPDPTSGNFHGNSSHTTGLRGTATTYVDGTVVIDGVETLTAVRRVNLGPKDVQQVRTKKASVERVQQAGYCWQARQLPDAILVENFEGFPAGTKFVTGKATEFGKRDSTDEGTGSEWLKVVQTNSEVFGCSLKQSILAAAFGVPLGSKPDLLRAQVEIFYPAKKTFARVPIVDVGPAERLEAVIDLTFRLDKFLGTDGSAQVQFRIVV